VKSKGEDERDQIVDLLRCQLADAAMLAPGIARREHVANGRCCVSLKETRSTSTANSRATPSVASESDTIRFGSDARPTSAMVSEKYVDRRCLRLADHDEFHSAIPPYVRLVTLEYDPAALNQLKFRADARPEQFSSLREHTRLRLC
jgi:hypothetical protein